MGKIKDQIDKDLLSANVCGFEGHIVEMCEQAIKDLIIEEMDKEILAIPSEIRKVTNQTIINQQDMIRNL